MALRPEIACWRLLDDVDGFDREMHENDIVSRRLCRPRLDRLARNRTGDLHLNAVLSTAVLCRKYLAAEQVFGRRLLFNNPGPLRNDGELNHSLCRSTTQGQARAAVMDLRCAIAARAGGDDIRPHETGHGIIRRSLVDGLRVSVLLYPAI